MTGTTVIILKNSFATIVGLDDHTHSLRRIFAGTWLTYAGFYLCRKNFAVLMPSLSTELHFSKDDLAQVVLFYSLAYSCGQLVNGTVADRIGAKRVVIGGMLLSISCTLAMAGADGLWVFAALQLLNGFDQSAGWPGLMKITAAWFDPARRGVLMAWWTSSYAAGGFLATVIATWFATGPVLPVWGWKRGAVGPALLLMVVAMIFSALVRERPSAG